MIIQTVKDLEGGGYLVNGTIAVPNHPSNGVYQRVLAWIAEGNTPEPFSIDPAEARAKRMHEIDADFIAAMAPIKAVYTDEEIQGWAQKLREIDLYLADQEALTPALDAELATGPDGSKADLVALIQTKVATYAQLYGQAVGAKRARQHAIEAIDLNAPDALQQIAAI